MKLYVTKNDKLVTVIKTYHVNLQYKKLLTITKINNIITECKICTNCTNCKHCTKCTDCVKCVLCNTCNACTEQVDVGNSTR